ncbi:hypothetical protein [Agrobacterium genomosp. 13]|uniref:hypothetical protein n=1 Tax=Agrobacterium genomosp. 13 TaxID=1183419 RepID=UPI001ABF1BFC|nr:hypothetical protein [Agrobacterium genomosp. 13]
MHVEHLDHQGFGKPLIGFGRGRIKHAPKTTCPALQIMADHSPPAVRHYRQQAEMPSQVFREKSAATGFHPRLNSLPCKIIMIKNFIIPSCPGGRKKYDPAKWKTEAASPSRSIADRHGMPFCKGWRSRAQCAGSPKSSHGK